MQKIIFPIVLVLLIGIGFVSAQTLEKSDLIIKDFKVFPDDDNDKFIIEIAIENIGNVPVDKSFYTTIYLDGNAYAREFVDDKIEPKHDIIKKYEYSFIVGTREIKAKADAFTTYAGETLTENYDNLINELNEDNNELSGIFKLNSEYQSGYWQCNDGTEKRKSADCWRKDVFRRQGEQFCQNKDGLKVLEVSTECEYVTPICGDNICSKGEGRGCEQVSGQPETNFCYIKCPQDCGVGFTNAQWSCYNDEEFNEEDKDNCNSYMSWQGLAVQACNNNCNENGQCGLVISSLKLSEECGEPFWTKISNLVLRIFGLRG